MEYGHKDPETLQRFILEACTEVDHADGDAFFKLMSSVVLASKAIAVAVAKAGIAGLYGNAGSMNSTGDDVKKLDIVSNDVFINSLKFSGECGAMVSEEDEEVLLFPSASGRFCAVFDPLDGSSNIDCNVSVGSIFGIYKRADPSAPLKAEDMLRPGNELVAGGYTIYGASTEIVLTFPGIGAGKGSGVQAFALDPAIGEFMHTRKNIRIPDPPKKVYSINEGNSKYWDEATRSFVEACKTAEKPYSLRYVGSMVADVHRTILYGGIFMYPGDAKSKNGKLRLLYEGNPMSLIVEQAGGRSTTGRSRILEVVPKGIHERTPVFCGCARDVDEIERRYKAMDMSESDASKRARTS